ncbi:hypothetical protein [Rhodopirellula sp. MGV]|uniref:hypothetical protein n=1 Tax=Rhodopirellula sp. MGV TaxID=2023130 RepID=UPI000B9794FA|nr:hypothetical protein [Rhodopirellula sp. MGV]OYP37119.1 hypothetical protein CGZ80_06110 [Rhodopirellula sp. MGV]PNY34409.1 hypothetical protein C2E31_23440 [Rhodopirellula baltica]
MNHVPNTTVRSTDALPDAAKISEIAREVLRRIKAGQTTATSNCEQANAHRLITIETLPKAVGNEIVVTPSGVVTPAAIEEAKRLGIRIVRQTKSASSAKPSVSENVGDEVDPFVQQLAKRGLKIPAGVSIVWTDKPAAEVFKQIQSGQRAVMISQWGDIDRFAAELSPQAWVLDRDKLSLPAAVNFAARIIKRGAQ